MPYTPFYDEWLNKPLTTTPITAEALNHMEQGIVTAQETAEAAGTGGGGGTGDGTVITVNGIEADPEGNVELAPMNIGAADDDHEHDAADIPTGVFAAAQIPSLNASKITAGVFDDDLIPVLDAATKLSGTIDPARLPEYVTTVNDESGPITINAETLEAVRNLTPTMLSGFGIVTELPTAAGLGRLLVLIPE
jgi:hypothetical protein